MPAGPATRNKPVSQNINPIFINLKQKNSGGFIMRKTIAMVTVLIFTVSAMAFAGVTKAAEKSAAAAVTTTVETAKTVVPKAAAKARHHKTVKKAPAKAAEAATPAAVK
jgi:hypothetical protein